MSVKEGGTLYKNGNAQMFALDASTGKILWQHQFEHVAFGGVTVVNDLVSTATLNGMVYALSRQDGSVVWLWQAPDGTHTWPGVVGDTIIWPFRLGGSGSIPTPQRLRPPVKTPEGR